MFVTPLLQDIWPFGDGPGRLQRTLSGLAMGVMILPMIASLSDDAMSAVPGGLREGALALGSNKAQVSTRVVIPAALSGIVAGFVLGEFARSRRDDDRARRRWRHAEPHLQPARRCRP